MLHKENYNSQKIDDLTHVKEHPLKDIETCCGDCKGGGNCSRIKIDFNTLNPS